MFSKITTNISIKYQGKWIWQPDWSKADELMYCVRMFTKDGKTDREFFKDVQTDRKMMDSMQPATVLLVLKETKMSL